MPIQMINPRRDSADAAIREKIGGITPREMANIPEAELAKLYLLSTAHADLGHHRVRIEQEFSRRIMREQAKVTYRVACIGIVGSVLAAVVGGFIGAYFTLRFSGQVLRDAKSVVSPIPAAIATPAVSPHDR